MASLVSLFIALPMSAQNSAKVQSMKQEQAKLQTQLNQSKQDLSANKQEVGVEKDTIHKIDVQLQNRLRRIEELQNDIANLDSQMTALQGQVDAKQKLLDKRKRQYIQSLRMARAYRSMKSPVLFIFSAHSITEMFRRARYATEYASYQRHLGEEVMAVQSELLERKNQLLNLKSAMNEKVSLIKEERRALAEEQAGHVVVVTRLEAEQADIQNRINTQQQQLAQLNQQIDAVIAAEIEAARKKAAEEAARRAAAEAARKKAAQEAAAKKAAEAAAKKAAAEAAAKKKAAEEAARKAAEAAAKKKAADEAAKKASEKAAKKAAEEAAKKDKKIEKKVEKTVDKAADEAAKAAKEAAKAAAKAEKEAKEAAAKAAKEAAKAKSTTPATTSTPAPSTATSASVPAAAASLNSSFEANRGRLPVPITGSYTIGTKFGLNNVQEHVQMDSKGVDYVGHPGAQARAIFDGEVTYVFQFGSTKNVLVRHGSYISVYCNLSNVSVKKGQHVSARTPLGTVATDENGTCTMHFQLRKETAKLNPEQWIGR